MRRLVPVLLALLSFSAFAHDSRGPYRVGGDVQAPKIVQRVNPKYPQEARDKRIAGVVIVEALVSREGDVRESKVLKPLPYGLDQAAVDAVKQWKFRPATYQGQPVDVLANFPVSFKLSGADDLKATTVILVRHAEKDVAPKDDPPLSADGARRAQALAHMFGEMPVTTIYTTPYARTRQTAEPLAKAVRVTPQEVAPGEKYPAEIARRIHEQPGSTIVVVGHSNTTRNVLRALGFADAKEIPESDFDNLFIVTLAEGVEPRLLSQKY
jgi:TonB family protein